MGLLRILLAAMVVFVHAGNLPGFPTMGGSLAVQTFFIISGFYMALILNEKYTTQPHAYRLFLTNRLLRLLPVYYVVVALTLLIAGIMAVTLGKPDLEFVRALHDTYDRMAASTVAFLAVANLTLIGQDWLSFLSFDPTAGTLIFAPDFKHTTANLNSLLLVQPAWTISLELTFYVVAPWLVRRKTAVLLVVIAVSAAIRYYVRVGLHLDGLAWNYRFFPSELMYFVAGALTYKSYKFLKNRQLPVWLCPLATGIALGYTLCFGLIHQALTAFGFPVVLASALYRLTILGTLPLVFLYTKHNRLDAKIGELSYPLYIIHFLVLETLLAYGVGGAYVNWCTLALSITAAWLVNRLVGERIERVRQRVFERNTPARHSLV